MNLTLKGELSTSCMDQSIYGYSNGEEFLWRVYRATSQNVPLELLAATASSSQRECSDRL